MRKFDSDTLLFGTHSAEHIRYIFDLFKEIKHHSVVDKFSDSTLSFLDIWEGGRDGFHRDYCNGGVRQNRYVSSLRRMPDDNVFATPIWAITLHYTVAIMQDHFDIEAHYKHENRKGDVSMSKKPARYSLKEISVIDNSNMSGQVEKDFRSLESRLLSLEEASSTLEAWAASGFGMGAICKRCSNLFTCREPQITLSSTQLISMQAEVTDLKALSKKLRCNKCGARDFRFLLSN